jgi:hypothetical protein
MYVGLLLILKKTLLDGLGITMMKRKHEFLFIKTLVNDVNTKTHHVMC